MTAENLGDAWVDGSVTPVVLEDTLPEHLEVVAVEAGRSDQGSYFDESFGGLIARRREPHHVRCVLEGTFTEFGKISERAGALSSPSRLFITVKTVGAFSSDSERGQCFWWRGETRDVDGTDPRGREQPVRRRAVQNGRRRRRRRSIDAGGCPSVSAHDHRRAQHERSGRRSHRIRNRRRWRRT